VTQYRALWIWLLAIAIGAAILVAAFRLDPAVYQWRREHRWKNIKLLSRYVTRTTDWPVHVAAGLAVAGLTYWRGNKKWTRIFLAMVAACALAGTGAYVLKMTTGRVRPSVKIEKVWGGPDLRQEYQSFPSGHTAASFGFFSVLLFVSWRTGLLFLPIPFFIGFTRIFLGAHYFSDVVGAALLGFLCAAIVARLMLQQISNQRQSGSDQSAISN
jgi:membrane-associated phospholipid phosphatase